MDYRFYLNDIECEEPIGWANFEISMNRDDLYHGMQFDAGTTSLQFFGTGAAYLMQQKESYGIQAAVDFSAQLSCDYETFAVVIQGRLNFGKYKDACASTCIVEIPFEEKSCKVIFNNRFDQKVDVDLLVAFDNSTVLPDYAQLGQTIQVPALALQAGMNGSVGDDGYELQCDYVIARQTIIWFRPNYDTQQLDTIPTAEFEAVNNMQASDIDAENSTCVNGPISPQLLLDQTDGGVECFDGEFAYHSHISGTFHLSLIDSGDPTPSAKVQYVKHVVLKWDGTTDSVFIGGELISEQMIADFTADPIIAPHDIDFDSDLSGTTTLEEGWSIYSVIEIILQPDLNPDPPHVGIVSQARITIDYTNETLFTLSATKLCPPSDTQYYMVHELLSRVAESITNKCMRVKSAYYGRIDSQPFAFDSDGCGSLRMLTSGLKLRRAPDAKFFVSAKDLISGLNGIDNIGFDIEQDEDFPDRSILRIEPIDYWYRDNEILSINAIAEVSNEIQEDLHYATINIGYKKWGDQDVNGLNEFNSNRQMRTNIETISTTLDIQSSFIAGGYPIEVTRQQSFAASGNADSTYDDEAFIVCLTRNAYAFAVEQNNILNPANIFSPETSINFRISPIRNLMRWFKSIINTYSNIFLSNSRIFFNAGTGNLTAAGLLNDTLCRLENGTLSENQSVGITNFTDQQNGTPIFKNEYAVFDYPLSFAQWQQIKANPYGYITYTCGNSATVNKGFIKEIKYRPAHGMANFTLRKKWGL